MKIKNPQFLHKELFELMNLTASFLITFVS